MKQWWGAAAVAHAGECTGGTAGGAQMHKRHQRHSSEAPTMLHRCTQRSGAGLFDQICSHGSATAAPVLRCPLPGCEQRRDLRRQAGVRVHNTCRTTPTQLDKLVIQNSRYMDMIRCLQNCCCWIALQTPGMKAHCDYATHKPVHGLLPLSRGHTVVTDTGAHRQCRFTPETCNCRTACHMLCLWVDRNAT